MYLDINFFTFVFPFMKGGSGGISPAVTLSNPPCPPLPKGGKTCGQVLRYFHVVDGPIVMLFLTTPVLQCPHFCLMELIYSLWRIPCISMGSGTPVLTVTVLSIKLDGIAPFISPVL